ncbi:pirin family protein [Leucobacter tardus]|uniref:Pirin family protein n=1 Tax=Leucobacter tardus TaxID=501483 RepID=A0A939QF60_9MICO|nr:pirin family protein [Leucobacter tardus]MBO2990781.1 pirin family protein [Leucobacter tardus]
MSNPDPHPTETRCTAGASGTHNVELLAPRDVPLGGLRAMNVRRTLPQRARSLIGAWCFLDHYGPDDVAATGGMNVPAHPHTGLQTVSWLFSGEIEHRDSAGYHATVRPGELNLMTAGAGISHSERSTPDTRVLHGAQLWVALPDATRNGPKGFEHYAPPVLRGDDWSAQVFLGSLLGDTSPVATHTPLVGAEIRLDPGAALTLDVDAAFEHGVLVDSGSVTVAAVRSSGDDSAHSCPVQPHELAYLAPGARTIRVSAGEAGSRILLIGGPRFDEEIIMWWNLVGRSHEEVAQARSAWQAELAAVGVGDPSTHGVESSPERDTPGPGRFGLPAHEPDAPLPAPKLPNARLRPRRQPR